MTLYATFRHPRDSADVVPGSLAHRREWTDGSKRQLFTEAVRSTREDPGRLLSQDGVASLRYDKLGSGRRDSVPTRWTPRRSACRSTRQEARSALEFLAKEKDVNDHELGVFGHSEGGLFRAASWRPGTRIDAADSRAGSLRTAEPAVPRPHHHPGRCVIEDQVKSGAITKSLEKTVESDLTTAVTQLRAKGTVKAHLPYGLATLLNPSDALFLAQADKFDPKVLAGHVDQGTRSFLTCSTTTSRSRALRSIEWRAGSHHRGFSRLRTLRGVDHVLKVDSSLTGTQYTKNLPFSPQLESALKIFVRKYL